MPSFRSLLHGGWRWVCAPGGGSRSAAPYWNPLWNSAFSQCLFLFPVALLLFLHSLGGRLETRPLECRSLFTFMILFSPDCGLHLGFISIHFTAVGASTARLRQRQVLRGRAGVGPGAGSCYLGFTWRAWGLRPCQHLVASCPEQCQKHPDSRLGS